MDKVAAYQSGVVEGLRSLNLPQEVKLAAAQYLFKVAVAAPSKPNKPSKRPSPAEKADFMRRMAVERALDAQEETDTTHDRAIDSFIDDAVVEMKNRKNRTLADLGPGYDDIGGDSYIPEGLDEPSSLALPESASPSILQLIKDNPGLATAAGLGAAGLGYGATRLFD